MSAQPQDPQPEYDPETAALDGSTEAEFIAAVERVEINRQGEMKLLLVIRPDDNQQVVNLTRVPNIMRQFYVHPLERLDVDQALLDLLGES